MSISESPVDPALNTGELLKSGCQQLAGVLNLELSTARIEVQCLMQSVLCVNRAYLFTHPERILSADERARYGELLMRRLNGEPIAYLLGQREFYGLELKVTPATLIPRPDTELLVELALQRMPLCCISRVLDMGTGSGAIAIAIAHQRPDAEVVAVDASEAALNVAEINVQRLQTNNVSLLHSDWFSALDGEHFDIIVSNPPYIESGDVHLGQGDVRFEPLTALASGTDGLNDMRRIIADARAHLVLGGWLMLEHGYNQSERVRGLLHQAGFGNVSSVQDLSGIERVTLGSV